MVRHRLLNQFIFSVISHHFSPKESFGQLLKPMADNNESWIEVQGIKIRRHAALENELRGKELVAFETYSSGTSGGRNAEYRMKLCRDGQIHVSESVHVSIYVGDMNESSTSDESDSGTWEAYENEEGAFFLKVLMKKSGEGYVNFGIQDGKVVMSGRAYHVQECEC